MLPLIASFGGLVAFLGLAIEKEADDDKAKEYLGNSWESAIHSKQKAKIGWRVLMVGIFIEIVVSFGLAVKEASDIADINSHTINAPVSKLSATMVVTLDGTNFAELPQTTSAVAVSVGLRNSSANELDLSDIGELLAFDIRRFNHKDFHTQKATYHGYVIDLEINPVPLMPEQKPKIIRPTVSQILEQINALDCSVAFLPKGTQITGGWIEMTVNGNYTKKFSIPAQKIEFPTSGPNLAMDGLYLFATNSP